MAERSKDRIETPQLTLVRATLPLLEAEESYVEARQRWHDLPYGDRLKNKVDQELRTRYCNLKALLGGDLAEPSWDRFIQAETGEPWPDPPDDVDSRDLAKVYLRSNPEWRWGVWYILFKRPFSHSEEALCIGTSGFRGPPSFEGSVEIGYWIVDRYQAVALATEAVGALVAHAFEDSRVQRVMAEAHAHHVPTIRVLGKNGFLRTGRGRRPGCLLFQRDREVAL